MEIRHLHYFLVLSEELNFTRAAEKLFISQPPLSRQIRELEIELQTQLFTRTNKKVALTEAGKYFKAEVTVILKSLELASQKTKQIGNHINGEFNIGYISSTFSDDISNLVDYLTHEFPYVTIRLYEIPTVRQINALESGKLDLGILRSPLISGKITSALWFEDDYAVVFNKKIYTLKTETDFRNLANETFVFFNKEYAPHFYQSLLELCGWYGFEPKVVHESNNIASIIRLVKSGLGASIVPYAISKSYTNDADLKFIRLKKSHLKTKVLLATPKGETSIITSNAVDFLLER
ncbi:LysR family transcriptional regulator [Zhouia sp. PK063]|uniref:LysR family transcriptional regulator n=1 Tax=Zhouia sp. PK063 TaxID=3373602 RepID=UPI0037B65D72